MPGVKSEGIPKKGVCPDHILIRVFCHKGSAKQYQHYYAKAYSFHCLSPSLHLCSYYLQNQTLTSSHGFSTSGALKLPSAC